VSVVIGAGVCVVGAGVGVVDGVLGFVVVVVPPELPPPVVIDEALELARQFSSDESLAFINGVLDAIHRQARAVGGASSSG